jgi:hypothetical protein
VRRNILYISTTVFAVILFFLWIYSLGVTFTNSDTQVKINQDLKPLSAIKNDMVDGYNSISQPSTTDMTPNENTDLNTTQNSDSNSVQNSDSNSDLKTLENNL